MKICWDNLEDLRLNRSGKFNKGSATYIEMDHCSICGDPYLMDKYQPTSFCSLSCTRMGPRNSMYGVRLWGRNNPNYKGGVKILGIPLYDTYAHQISYVEEIQRWHINSDWMQVKCTYCGKWYVPTTDSVQKRIKALDGRGTGENRFYCSSNCKAACSIYRQVKYPKGFKPSTSREVQPELRQLVFERDSYTCQKCNKSDVEIHCHHIDPVSQNPIESADMDNCITLCKSCHKEVHKQSGCSLQELKCE